MKNKSSYHFSYALVLILFLHIFIAAQVPTSTPEELSGKTQEETEASLLHLGDLIDVDVIGSVEYDWRGVLNPEGFLNGITFVENPIFGLCRSEQDVAEDVAKAYSKLLRDPKVVVRILDRSNRPLSILYGAVKTPQRFQIKRPVFLNELIIVSGGITDKASGEIQIFRAPSLNCQSKIDKNSIQSASSETKERFLTASQDNGQKYINIKISDLLAGKKEANPQILSGDIVTILEAQPIYIIGGVTNPRQISTNSTITLSRAIASAGGITKDGDEKKVTVFRRSGTERTIIEADLEKIKSGQQEDVGLQAFDIIEVAQSGREKRTFPPVIKVEDANDKNPEKLPLRIVD